MAKNKKKQDNVQKLSFKEATELTSEIATCFENGLKGLGANSKKIELADPRLSEGSLDIDKGLETLYPQSNRWDYALSYDGKVYFVEVHTASTREVRTMFNKLQWLKDWLLEKAPEINKLKAAKPFYWVASNRVDILKTSPQYKQLATKGLLPIAKLKLPTTQI